ncbi:MAG: hypothetical protein Q4B42_04570 [Oscillospiraceae bacterium]|nr:hypothetical protein [Oscillospiraceae bacterium]
MKIKKAAAVLMLAALCLTGCSGSHDFRSGNWGDDPAAVDRREELEYLYASDELVMYSGEAYGKNAEIYYVFDESGLCEGQVKFLVGDWILEDIIADYKETAAEMADEFGAPLNEDYRVWDTQSAEYEEHKGDTDIYAMYYKILEYRLEWDDGETLRSLTLNYRDEQINYLFDAAPKA